MWTLTISSCFLETRRLTKYGLHSLPPSHFFPVAFGPWTHGRWLAKEAVGPVPLWFHVHYCLTSPLPLQTWCRKRRWRSQWALVLLGETVSQPWLDDQERLLKQERRDRKVRTQPWAKRNSLPLFHGRKGRVDWFAKILRRTGCDLVLSGSNKPPVSASCAGLSVRTPWVGVREEVFQTRLWQNTQRNYLETLSSST